MAFKDFAGKEQGVQLLQRSLERGRLAHAYLFTGSQIRELEAVAQSLAKTLNCREPIQGASGVAIDSCDHCINCRKIEGPGHPDVHWIRPESKSRLIVIDQVRDLMRNINLKPAEAEYKVAVIVGAERMNVAAANAFLKTLEEPPAKSILILLSTDAARLLETILSRCLRLNFGAEGVLKADPAHLEWLKRFGDMAAGAQTTLLGRYRLLDLLLQHLAGLKSQIEGTLTERSPIQRYEEADKSLRDKWEDELVAAIESEYRRQRAEILSLLQWWLRDVWLETLARKNGGPVAGDKVSLLGLPQISGAQQVAARISVEQALANLDNIEGLQRLLNTNVQEALALEVGLLKLHL